MTFDQILKGQAGKTVVVLFYGSACRPCEILKPKLRGMCTYLDLPLVEFNSATEMAALRALGVRSVPVVFVVSRAIATLAFTGDAGLAQIESRLGRICSSLAEGRAPA